MRGRDMVAGYAVRPLLVWAAVALLLVLAGCSGAPAAADEPESGVRFAGDEFPTSYPASKPAADEIVLKWNGTLVLKGDAAR